MWRMNWPVPKRAALVQSFAMRCLASWLRSSESRSEEKLKRMSWWESVTDCLAEKRKWMNGWKKPHNCRLWFSWGAAAIPPSTGRVIGWDGISQDFWNVFQIIFWSRCWTDYLGEGAVLQVLLARMEELVGSVRVGDSLGCKNKIMEFKILREVRKASSVLKVISQCRQLMSWLGDMLWFIAEKQRTTGQVCEN